jgi:hypothetical protein
MLDNKNEMARIVEIIERERYTLKMAFIDTCSNQVVDILFGALVASYKSAVKALYRTRFSEIEKKMLERITGTEEKILQMIIDETDDAIGDHRLDKPLEAIEKLADLLTVKSVQVKKVV